MLALADDAALARLVIAAAQRRLPLPASKLSESRGRGHARAASTTRLHELAIEIDRGDGMAGGERDDLMPAHRKERIAVHDECATPVETAYFLMQSFKNALLSEAAHSKWRVLLAPRCWRGLTPDNTAARMRVARR